MKYFWVLCFVFNVSSLLGQVGIDENSPKFTVRGKIIESETRDAIPNANIEVNGGSYTTSDMFGEFRVQARKGDELIIRHKDFETIYYIIQNNERILVKVEPNEQDKFISKSSKKYKKQSFNSYIDSAEVYLKKDAKKSIQFVTDALELSNSKKENAEAYEVLGDINMFWKQYDLAVSNYRTSLRDNVVNEVELKLAWAYKENRNYQESIELYNAINKRGLSNYQLVTLYEGLGDVYKEIGQSDASIQAYQDGLKVAQKHIITPKITDLNSKIAEVYNDKGEVQEAQGFFSNSLRLAEGENKKRALQEKIKVADFESKNLNYSTEIELRKQALEDIEDIQLDSILDNKSPLTSQKQNYKIGKAYALQNDIPNAINYLEKSIEEADDREDLIVQKDATRGLSEVYRDAGQFNKALIAYQSYVDIVDKIYALKEQEISQAAKFGKDIVNQQTRINSLESQKALIDTEYQLNTEQAKRQKLLIYSLLGGLLLLLIVAFLMFKYIRQQKLANNLLALKSLRSQMNPHFIFNALNSVNSFIASNDERTANKYLSDFSLLMRAVLENSEEDFIPLEKEIELLQLYTKLEHFRFKDRFDYAINIDENINIKDFVIPPMLLQPYIENAVWHGLRYKKSKGQLEIAITQTRPDEISVAIIDDGVGRKKSKALKTENQQKQNSKGMGNIKKRVSILNDMYKDKVDVLVTDFQDAEDTGTKVEVTLKKD
ncbi:tetratricopeptide repeat-containing sensor histidine kinase [Seonamhaeicola maritimus]|uniref:Tetratricopeptide repeat protein n=1 Tax=Seonamhaeicola maritimus TaxID=2591822 RepID=A0A5C7GJ29_9FLAO|nr:histidine kinase [Seonamhaeicola maritimus]TXG38332.1 tetratricopeptide repeat protein [Seonamhaeicola maritimus]